MNRQVFISGLFLCAALLLAGCDEKSAAGASTEARWEKVCAKPYFYNFLDARGQTGNMYCGEWRNQCVGADGKPSDGCA